VQAYVIKPIKKIKFKISLWWKFNKILLFKTIIWQRYYLCDFVS